MDQPKPKSPDLISAWKTSDGKVHTDRKIAREHQKIIDRQKAAVALVDNIFPKSSPTKTEIVQALLKNRADVIQALQ